MATLNATVRRALGKQRSIKFLTAVISLTCLNICWETANKCSDPLFFSLRLYFQYGEGILYDRISWYTKAHNFESFFWNVLFIKEYLNSSLGFAGARCRSLDFVPNGFQKHCISFSFWWCYNLIIIFIHLILFSIISIMIVCGHWTVYSKGSVWTHTDAGIFASLLLSSVVITAASIAVIFLSQEQIKQ